MELTFTTLQPLAHYDPSLSKADADDTASPVAGPSSVSAATTAFKRELEDRTFDVDDEEFELEAAFERGEDDTDGDHDEDGNLSAGETSPGHKPKHELGDPPQQGSTSERSSSSSFTADSQGLYGDVFPEEVADAMIRELKEIGMFRFIQKYVVKEDVPLPKMLAVFGVMLPANAAVEDPLYLLRVLKVVITRTLRNRETLPQYGTPSAFVDLLRQRKNIIVLTGAGISTNCGIPDFRSPEGIYARLVASGRYPELTDPQEMFDIQIFKEMPDLFYSFAKELYPDTSDTGGKKRAGVVHNWIRSLEKEGKLLRNYTQNIDTLEKVAGIEKVLYAHGSFATCSCLICHTHYPGDSIKEAVFAQTVPLCPKCAPTGVVEDKGSPPKKKSRLMDGQANDESDTEDWRSEWYNKPILKPDITFFGQPLDDAFDKCLIEDREEADLLIIIGTSLQILINRDPVPHVMDRIDLALLGDCDQVIEWIKNELDGNPSNQRPKQLFDEIGHVWALEGANLDHKWIQKVKNFFDDQGSEQEEEEKQEIDSKAEDSAVV